MTGAAPEVARSLLGVRLVREDADGRREGRVVEVEAYGGPDDRASHARFESTRRNRIMAGPAGVAYVYLVYGMYDCLNVVTGEEGAPSAVLVRAVEPLAGVDQMREARLAVEGRRRVGRTPAGIAAAKERLARTPADRLASGPGLVAAAFGVDTTWTGTDLCDPSVAVAPRARPGRPGRHASGRPRPRQHQGRRRVCRPRMVQQAVAVHDRRAPIRVRAARPLGGLRMDSRSQALLEFPLVRARLAEATAFPPSRRLAEALEPSADPVVVARSLDETDQTRALLSDRPGVGIGAAHDIGPSIERAVRGGRLDPEQFLAIADTLDATARLATSLTEERRPLLRDLGRELHPLPAVRSTLARTFDPVGELLDTASPRLGGLRAAVRVAYDRLRRRLDTLVGAELGNALQEPIVTLRNGRYVVPVKAEARSRVKGIVHDASGSGQTLFIEPLVAVELGNAWREAQVAEQEEVARILDELSALIGGQCGSTAGHAGCAGAVRPVGCQGVAGRRDGRHPCRDGRPLRGRAPLGAPPGSDRTRGADRRPHRRRLHRPRRDRPEYRWQDRDAAHARAAEPDAPIRAAHPGGSRQPTADLA